jgi:hypothetical protein
VETDLIERRQRGEGGDVAADPLVLVGAHDHGDGVPAHDALELALQVAVAGIGGLLFGGDGVDVGGVERRADVHAVAGCLVRQLLDQESCPIRAAGTQDAGQGVGPFARFTDVGVAAAIGILEFRHYQLLAQIVRLPPLAA